MNSPVIISLIPARGGSKSIPRKNLRMLAGKPMIAHSIEQSLQSSYICRTIVTTDDLEIATVAKKYGADVPFLRPTSISGDLSTDYEYTRHALEWLKDNQSFRPDLIVQLRPTTPQRDVEMIDKAIEHLIATPEADSLRTVVSSCFSPYKMWKIGGDGYLDPLITDRMLPEAYNSPRQILPQCYQQDGFLDITRYSTVFDKGSITGRNILPFIIDKISLDIDHEHELTYACDVMSDN